MRAGAALVRDGPIGNHIRRTPVYPPVACRCLTRCTAARDCPLVLSRHAGSGCSSSRQSLHCAHLLASLRLSRRPVLARRSSPRPPLCRQSHAGVPAPFVRLLPTRTCLVDARRGSGSTPGTVLSDRPVKVACRPPLPRVALIARGVQVEVDKARCCRPGRRRCAASANTFTPSACGRLQSE